MKLNQQWPTEKKNQYNLRGQDDEESTKKVQALLIETLHDSDGTNGVSITTTIGHSTVGKDGDDNMLFHVERTRIQTEPPTENAHLPRGESSGHEFPNWEHGNLHEDGRNGKRLRSVGEERVEED